LPVTEIVHERVLRGIPRWLLRGYLEELGGHVVEPDARGPVRDAASGEEDVLTGDGWKARLIQLEDFRVGSLSSGQVRLVVTGDPDAVRGMLSRLAPRLFRGGG
jgi:hypothetical protein